MLDWYNDISIELSNWAGLLVPGKRRLEIQSCSAKTGEWETFLTYEHDV